MLDTCPLPLCKPPECVLYMELQDATGSLQFCVSLHPCCLPAAQPRPSSKLSANGSSQNVFKLLESAGDRTQGKAALSHGHRTLEGSQRKIRFCRKALDSGRCKWIQTDGENMILSSSTYILQSHNLDQLLIS